LPTLVSSLGRLGVPVVGVIVSTLWLGESLTPALLVGLWSSFWASSSSRLRLIVKLAARLAHQGRGWGARYLKETEAPAARPKSA